MITAPTRLFLVLPRTLRTLPVGLLCVASLLMACSSLPPSDEKRAQALAPLFPNSVIVDVKPAGVAFSDRLLISSMRVGLNSESSNQILGLLKKKLTLPIVVTGDNHQLTVVTLLRALQAGKGQIEGARVVLLGHAEYPEALQDAARAAGVRFDILELPATPPTAPTQPTATTQPNSA